jgi:hypothetical protein
MRVSKGFSKDFPTKRFRQIPGVESSDLLMDTDNR